ncbi:ferric/cupric-chelate reductase [Irineochytrium annulatum]|nr:ferric/cupric-chelate reductase [Irineochytrium annulatum]
MISKIVAAGAFVGAAVLSTLMINNPSYSSWITYTTENQGQLEPLQIHFVAYYAFLVAIALALLVVHRVPYLSTHKWFNQDLAFYPRRDTLERRPSTTKSVGGFLGWLRSYSVSVPLALLWCAVSAFQAWTFWFWYVQLLPIYGSNWGAALGAISFCASVQMGLTLFPTSHGNVLSRTLGINFDDGLRFHRTSGALAIIYALLHVLFYVISNFATGFTEENKRAILAHVFLVGVPPSERKWVNYTGVWAVISTVLFIWVAITSVAWIRRHRYSWFYVNHFLVLIAVVAGSLHASPVFYSILPGLLIYTVDGFRRLFHAFTSHPQVRSIVREPNGYLRVEISGLTRPTQPGQWLSLNIPAIDKVSYHPFTIVGACDIPQKSGEIRHVHANEARGEGPEGTVSILVKPSQRAGSWTRSLDEFVARREMATTAPSLLEAVIVEPSHKASDDDLKSHGQSSSSSTSTTSSMTDEGFLTSVTHSRRPSVAVPLSLPCRVQGPFGALPRGFLTSPTILILCAGSGISGGLYIARSALTLPTPPCVRMVWTTHDDGAEDVEGWTELVKMCEERKGVEMVLHVTRKEEGGKGRLDVGGVMQGWKNGVEDGRVSVYTCGPREFTGEVVRGAGVFEKRIVHAEGFVR